ncbi:heavy metal translocatin [Poronia punctata]|nr:heavy metal translocatin [Poronia punctata]
MGADCCSHDKTSTSIGTEDTCYASSNEKCIDESRDQLTAPQAGCRAQAGDVEKGQGEMVRIGVAGMTCNGCGENLKRKLAAHGARNIHVNYLQGHADFTIDCLKDLHIVIDKVQKATGFQITAISGDESLIVLTSGLQASNTLAHLDLSGVGDIKVLNRNTVRIQYDPTIIGARVLLRKLGSLSVQLAPPHGDGQFTNAKKRFITLLTLTSVSFTLTIPILVLAWGDRPVAKHTKAVVSLVLGTLVQALAVPVFYKPALQSLIRYRVFELDMLVVVSITAAFVYSVVAFGYLEAGSPLQGDSLFETSALLISLIMLGRLITSYMRIREVEKVSVRSLQIAKAVIVEDGVDREMDARLLQFGDIFKVAPHNKIPTDGTVVSGCSEVDESMVTGESTPVPKATGSSLVAGTTNGSGILFARLTRLPGRNTITDIAKLVEDASSSKPRVQEMADKVAGWFLPVVAMIAAAVFVTWTVVGIEVKDQSAGNSVAIAITYTVAVLAVTCPCGLSLAVPLVLVIANGIAARGGIIIKSAECTERARKITDVVFDKTGTLTEPALDVVVENYFNSDPEDARAVTKALVDDSQHPVSTAISKHLQDVKPSLLATAITSIPGHGIEASISGRVIRAGHARWTGSEWTPEVRKLKDDGLSILVVTRDLVPIALYGLHSHIRDDAVATVARLRREGIKVHLVSGDQDKAVRDVAAAVSIDEEYVASQRTPSEKRDYVASLMKHRGRSVLFCGDGTNDAPAVAQANIGVQLSTGDAITSEVTRSAADVVLLSGLRGIPFLMDVSRASHKRIVFNFVWSAVYNVFAVLLAAGAFVKITIRPAYAGAGECVSIIPIILAAWTMRAARLGSE